MHKNSEDVIFGQRLKELRLKKKWNQTDLAKASGCSQSDISRWERGEVSPSWAAVVALCKALGVACSTFMEPVEPDGNAAT